jgi:hypothetical protein
MPANKPPIAPLPRINWRNWRNLRLILLLQYRDRFNIQSAASRSDLAVKFSRTGLRSLYPLFSLLCVPIRRTCRRSLNQGNRKARRLEIRHFHRANNFSRQFHGVAESNRSASRQMRGLLLSPDNAINSVDKDVELFFSSLLRFAQFLVQRAGAFG